jgi:hypothetical protein
MNVSYRFGWLTYLTKQTWYRKHLVTKQEVLWHLFFIGIVGMAELNYLFYVYLKTFPSWNISKIAQFILLRGFCKSFWQCLIHCIALVSDILYGLRQSGPKFFFPWVKKVFTPASYTGGGQISAWRPHIVTGVFRGSRSPQENVIIIPHIRPRPLSSTSSTVYHSHIILHLTLYKLRHWKSVAK